MFSLCLSVYSVSLRLVFFYHGACYHTCWQKAQVISTINRSECAHLNYIWPPTHLGLNSTWNSTSEEQIVEHLSLAKRCARVFAPAKLSEKVLVALHQLLERGVALDLIVGKERNDSEESPFYFYKVLNLANEGASLYSLDLTEQDSTFRFQTDYAVWVFFEVQEARCHRFAADVDKAVEVANLFDDVVAKHPEFRSGADDLLISFETRNPISLKGAMATLFWKVSNATSVEIDGLGQVPASGQAEISVNNTSIIRLYAFNGRLRKTKALLIQTVERPKIVCDVQFLNPASNQYVSLPEDAGSGVFGVAKGYRVRLVWEVLHAERVTIVPLGEVATIGQHDFMPDGPVEFTITASLQHTTEERTLLLQTFPVAIYSEALVPIATSWMSDAVFQLDDVQLSLNRFLDENRQDMVNKERELLSMVEALEKSIFDRMKELDFEGFYEHHTIASMNKTIGERIKNYFRNEPEILELIKSMRTYYE